MHCFHYMPIIWLHVTDLYEGESHKRPQKVAQVTVCRRSEHHAVFIGCHAAFIGCQHQHCPHYCLGLGTGAKLTLGNAVYCLQGVQFVGSQLRILEARTMDRSNDKLGEGAKLLF